MTAAERFAQEMAEERREVGSDPVLAMFARMWGETWHPREHHARLAMRGALEWRWGNKRLALDCWWEAGRLFSPWCPLFAAAHVWSPGGGEGAEAAIRVEPLSVFLGGPAGRRYQLRCAACNLEFWIDARGSMSAEDARDALLNHALAYPCPHASAYQRAQRFDVEVRRREREDVPTAWVLRDGDLAPLPVKWPELWPGIAASPTSPLDFARAVTGRFGDNE
jgi:hypothetical protein